MAHKADGAISAFVEKLASLSVAHVQKEANQADIGMSENRALDLLQCHWVIKI